MHHAAPKSRGCHVRRKDGSAASPAIDLLPVLTDGSTHAVVIVDEQVKIVGIISQTDLLAALGRSGLYTQTST